MGDKDFSDLKLPSDYANIPTNESPDDVVTDDDIEDEMLASIRRSTAKSRMRIKDEDFEIIREATEQAKEKLKKKWRERMPANMCRPKKNPDAIIDNTDKKKVVHTITELCIDCELRFNCPRVFEDFDLGVVEYKEQSKCVYDKEGKHNIKRGLFKNYKAFVSTDPADMLLKIESVFRKLEATVDKDPSYTKIANMLYMLINIYKLKFGEKVFSLSVKKDMTNPTLDIKTIMKELRGEERKIIEVSRQLDTNRITTITGDTKAIEQSEQRIAQEPTITTTQDEINPAPEPPNTPDGG